MDKSVNSGQPTSMQVPNTSYVAYGLTIMDTNTKVTNSPLATVNPTPVPFAVSGALPTSYLSPTVQVPYLTTPDHLVITSDAKTTPSESRQVIVPLNSNNGPHKIMGVGSNPIKELLRMPQMLESTHHLCTTDRRITARHPRLIQNDQSFLLVAQHKNQRIGESQQASCENSNQIVPAGMVMLAVENSKETTNTARIAQLLSPAGPPLNSQVILCSTQSNIQGDFSKKAVVAGKADGTQPAYFYYAVAPAELLRHLRATPNAIGQEDISKQPPTNRPMGRIVLPSYGTLAPGIDSRTRGQSAPSTKLIGTTGYDVDSSTFPRNAMTDHGLICTCPPEMHPDQPEKPQEGSKKSLSTHQAQWKNPQIVTPKSSLPKDITTTNEEKTRDYLMRSSQVERRSSTSPSNTSNSLSEKQSSTCGKPLDTPNISDQNKEKNEKEAHTNYLVTLFQALRASGVQAEAFKDAFARVGLSNEDSGDRKVPPTRETKCRCEEIRKSVSEIRQLKESLRSTIKDGVKRYQDLIENLDLNQLIPPVSKQSMARIEATNPASVEQTFERNHVDRNVFDKLLLQLHSSQISLKEQLHDLECIIEQTGNDVLQHRCHITPPYVQTLDQRLDFITRTLKSTGDLLPDVHKKLNEKEDAERRVIESEKKYLSQQKQQLEDLTEKCKRIKGTIMTLKRLALVNVHNRHRAASPRRFAHLGGVINRAAADSNSIERKRLYASINAIEPDSNRRMQAIKKQELLASQKRRIFADTFGEIYAPQISPSAGEPPSVDMALKECGIEKQHATPSSDQFSTGTMTRELMKSITPIHDEDCRERRAAHVDNDIYSCKSTTFQPCEIHVDADAKDAIIAQTVPLPMGILKAKYTSALHTLSKQIPKSSRGVMFNTIVTVEDGSEVIRLNCTLDESELGKNAVPPTEEGPVEKCQETSSEGSPTTCTITDTVSSTHVHTAQLANPMIPDINTAPDCPPKIESKKADGTALANSLGSKHMSESTASPVPGMKDMMLKIPTPPPRRSSQIEQKIASQSRHTKEYENFDPSQLESVPLRWINRKSASPTTSESIQQPLNQA